MPRTSFLADLRAVLVEKDFRRLLATRLVSQAGDGMFTAGLGTYVFFDQNTFPNPGTAAAAFAVLYLPYSLIGPFAGVFIDRWSRRQILVWSALLRAGLVVFTASLMAAGRLGAPLYVSVLAVLGVNRFFLSSLSAALPHVVAEDKLTMANSVAPTTGTLFTFLGALVALGVQLATGKGTGGSAVILLAAGGCYLLSGSVAATMHRGLLGPPPLAEGEQRASVRSELGVVARGLAAGARHVWHRRPAVAALGATGALRAMTGILLLVSVLLYRNYFYPASAKTALAHYTLVLIALAAGYGGAAVITPLVTARLTKQAWIALLLVTGGAAIGVLGPTFQQPPYLAMGVAVGLVAQGVAICATTILQQQVDDSYRGRVFALYDMLFNLPFVIGAVVVAQVIPNDGKSYLVVAVVAAGYLVAGLLYAAASRQELRSGPSAVAPVPGGPGGSPEAAPPGTSSPPASAQRSSS